MALVLKKKITAIQYEIQDHYCFAKHYPKIRCAMLSIIFKYPILFCIKENLMVSMGMVPHNDKEETFTEICESKITVI